NGLLKRVGVIRDATHHIAGFVLAVTVYLGKDLLAQHHHSTRPEGLLDTFESTNPSSRTRGLTGNVKWWKKRLDGRALDGSGPAGRGEALPQSKGIWVDTGYSESDVLGDRQLK